MKNVIYDVDRFIDDWVRYMKANDISQIEFSNLAGMTPSKTSRLLNKVSAPSWDTFNKIAKIINVSVDDYNTDGGYILNVDTINIDILSVEEIDRMINRLRSIRLKKLTDELNDVRNRENTILELLKEE